MSGKVAVAHEVALIKAQALVHHLTPVCERIEIAGSIRRNKPEVGDIELVAIPKMFEPVERDLFGEPVGEPADRIKETLIEASAAEAVFDTPLAKGAGPWLEQLNDGKRYLKLRDRIANIQVDLFLVRPPAQWGPIFAIRTGPAEFSQRLVKGLHIRKMKCVKGRVIDRNGETVDCPTEEQFFRLAGFRYKPPEERR